MINSNACIMSLSKTMSAETTRALTVLQEAVSNYFNCTSNAYSSVKQLLSQLGERLNENSLVIIAVEPALFYSAKEIFCQALSLKCENSEDVIASLPTSYFPKNEREYRVVAGFPKHSDILFTPNGLFSGFCVANGTQRIAFVPLEEKITATLLAGSLGETLARFGDENNIVVSDILADDAEADAPVESAAAAAEEKGTEETDDEPKTISADAVPAAAPVESAAPVATATAEPAKKTPREILKESVEALVKALVDTDSTLAIAQNASLKHLLLLIKNTAGSEDHVVFDETPVEKWAGGKFNEYFANLAKGTFERCGTDYAGAASTLYSDATGRFMFYVVADSQGAKITKVTGNDPNEIIFKTMTGLISALKERILANAAVRSEEEEETAGNEVVKSSTPLIISAIVLIIAIIASAAVAFYMKDSNDADIPETTAYVEEITEPETTEPETTQEETAEEETGEESEESTQEDEETSEESAE